MTTYEPPTQNLRNFNSSVFKSANDIALTLAQAKSLFLGRTGNPTSTANSTTFTETVLCKGTNTTNGSIQLNGGLQLQTTYPAVPTSTMIGYTITQGLTVSIQLSTNPTVISNLYSFTVPTGVWILLFQTYLISTNNLTITFMNQCMALSPTSTTSFQTTGGQFVRNLTEVFNNVDLTSTPGTAVISNFSSPFTLYMNVAAAYSGAGILSASGSYILTRIG